MLRFGGESMINARHPTEAVTVGLVMQGSHRHEEGCRCPYKEQCNPPLHPLK